MKRLLGKRPTASAVARAGMMALLTFATSTIALGQATPNTTLYADTGSINAPHSGVWVGDPYNAATPGRLWIADSTAGLCRLDPTDPAAQPAPTAPFQLTSNVNGAIPQEQACFPAANAAASTVGQPDVLYAAGPSSAYVFVPISLGNIGVYRLTIDLATQSITTIETLATAAQLGTVTSPSAVSMGADGKLYVGDTTSGVIVRITNPAAALGTQIVQPVGTNAGAGLISLSLHNNDLYANDVAGGFLYRQAFADTCNGTCTTTQTNMTSQAVVADRSVSTGNKYVYFDNSGIEVDAERVLQYDAINGTMTLYSPGIFDSTGTVTTPFASIAGLIADPAGNLYVVDDGSAGAANSGRVFQIPAGSIPYSSSTGLIGPPPVPVRPAAKKVSPSYATGVSTVSSTVWIDGTLGGHLWVSDASKGFCQLSGGVLDATTCFKPTVNGFVAGQSAVGITTDAAGNDVVNVYVPDSGSSNSGIYRVAFDPTTELLGAAINIGRGSSTPSAVVVGLEGSLYVGYKTSGQIDKFTTPSTRPTLVTRIAQTFSGSGVKSMAFLSNDLYLVESTQVTVVPKASPALTRGAAQQVGGAQRFGGLKGTPSLQITNPLSITTDGNDILYIGSQGQVNQYQLSTSKQTLLSTSGGDGSIAFGKITGIGMDPSGGLYAADDGSASTSQGAVIWKVLP